MEFVQSDNYAICDFAMTHDCGSRIQQQFYVQGLIQSPANIFGNSGTHWFERKTGIVFMPLAEFEQFNHTIQQQILHNPKFCYYQIGRVKSLFQSLENACQIVEQAAKHRRPQRRAVEKMMNDLLCMMSFNVLYELFPNQEFTNQLDDLIENERLSQKVFLDSHFSFTLPHYTRINLGLLQLAKTWAEQGQFNVLESQAFIDDTAFAYDFYIGKNEMEKPDSLKAHVIQLAESFQNNPQRIQREVESIHAGRQKQAAAFYQAWKVLHSAMIRKDIPQPQQLCVLSGMGLRQALATEEEERHFLQMRVQRDCRLLMEQLDLPLTTTTLEELLERCGQGDHR